MLNLSAIKKYLSDSKELTEDVIDELCAYTLVGDLMPEGASKEYALSLLICHFVLITARDNSEREIEDSHVINHILLICREGRGC